MLRFREGEQRATRVELFFDLVFVFAITQLSALLVSDISVKGRRASCSCCSSCGGPGTTRRG